MRLPGIVGTVQLAVVVAFAAPIFLFGVERMLAGRPAVGVAFIVLAGLMLLMHWRLTNPLDPADLVERAVERLTPDEK